jgi:hypothetical protein
MSSAAVVSSLTARMLLAHIVLFINPKEEKVVNSPMKKSARRARKLTLPILQVGYSKELNRCWVSAEKMSRGCFAG